jgi:biotin operon repressor
MHGLRLKGFAEAAAIAEAAGLSTAETEKHLQALQSEGFVQYREGRMCGYSLTSAGRAEHERQLTAELDGAGARAELDSSYRRFLQLNQELLSVCTSWQLRDVAGHSTVNDHTDGDYDKAVIATLGELDAKVQPICGELAGVFDRFAAYGPRLAEALDRVQNGEIEYFTKPMIPSYHTVWFELHEDLLASLGIERASESET